MKKKLKTNNVQQTKVEIDDTDSVSPINYHLLDETVFREFKREEFPFLNAAIASVKRKNTALLKNYSKRLKIIDNDHITLSTLRKYAHLAKLAEEELDAELVVTVSPGLNYDPRLITVLEQAGVHFCPFDKIEDDYDIVLDCCAGLIEKVRPRIGAVELTKTGIHKYKDIKDYPIISIDDSDLKLLETLYGTGDGFVRALTELTGLNTDQIFKQNKFLVFGFGKVGRGIVRAIRLKIKECHPDKTDKQLDEIIKNNIIIIEQKDLISDLTKQYPNLTFVQNQDIPRIKKILKEGIFAVVTITGIEGIISKSFCEEDFANCLFLTNMGSENEYGPNFKPERLLCEGKMINFCMEKGPPTQARFIEHVLYAHNLAATLFLYPYYRDRLKKGVNSFPQNLDTHIIDEYCKYYHEDINEIFPERGVNLVTITEQPIQRQASFRQSLNIHSFHYSYSRRRNNLSRINVNDNTQTKQDEFYYPEKRSSDSNSQIVFSRGGAYPQT